MGLTLATTLLTEPIVLAAARRLAVIDHPEARSSHTRPTPRGGGAAVVLGLAIGLAAAPDVGAWRPTILVALGLFAAIGLVEDLGSIRPIRRLCLHALAAALVGWIAVTQLQIAGSSAVAAALISLAWVVGFTNSFNFMDGINGISAAMCIVTGIMWALVGHNLGLAPLTTAGVITAVGCAMFLPWNFPNARIFLGDVGSYALGALLATVAFLAVLSGAPVEAIVAPLGLYLADTIATFIRRISRGEVWYSPHCSHAYQRLTRVGWTHVEVTSFVTLILIVCSLLGAVSLRDSLPARAMADALVVLLLVAYLAIPGALERHRVAVVA